MVRRNRRTGVVAAVVVGAVVVVGAGAAHRHSRAGGGHLSVPRTLDHGRYALVRDSGSAAAAGAWARGLTTVGGSYRHVDGSGARDVLDVDGGYGTVEDGARAVRGLLVYAEDTGGAQVAVSPQVFAAPGAGREVTCEVVGTDSAADHRVYLPVCAWADASTAGVVSRTDFAALAPTAAAVDLRAAAGLTETVRGELGDG